MLKAGLVVPLLGLCCQVCESRAPHQSEDGLRSAMLVLHEALKSPSFQGTSAFLRSGLPQHQVHLPGSLWHHTGAANARLL